jgi:hypothetical protein
MPTVGIAPVALQQFFDVDGNPLAGGKLFTYSSGTTTPLATYADSGGVTQNPNPLILDSGGFASPGLFLQALAYTFALTDSNNIPQWTQNGIISEQAVSHGLNVPSSQVFTSSGTFTIPTNVSAAKVTVVAGGGAGGGSTAAPVNGSGGGAGGAGIKWLSGLIPGNTLAVTVGTGGTGVGSGGGNAGGASSVASGTQTITTIATNGGAGGNASGATSNGAAGGAAGTGGDLNMGGGGSQPGIALVGGGGGNSIFGGGAQPFTGTPGKIGAAPGAGGGGSSGATGTGGAGANGIVIFEFLQ